jgi:hypothetical protein
MQGGDRAGRLVTLAKAKRLEVSSGSQPSENLQPRLHPFIFQ